MLNYIIRRLLLMVPTLVGITFVVFMVMALSPGGVGASLLSAEGGMRPEERAAMRRYYNKRFGLNKPVLVQYGRWLNQVSPVGFAVHEDEVPVMETGPDGRETPAFKRDAKGQYERDRFGDPIPILKVEAGGIDFSRPLIPKWPDLGTSFLRRQPVSQVILEVLPVTLLFNLLTLPLVYGISIWTGIMSASRKGGKVDVGVGAVFLAFWSVPNMLAGVLVIGFLANRDFIQLLPTGGLHSTLATSMPFFPRFSGGFNPGWLLDMIWHIVGPLAVYTYASFAYLSKLTRSSFLENLASDYVRTARAKGVSEHDVLYQHVLRNSLLPLITVSAGILPGLLGGSVIVERIFSINGMGRLIVDAVFVRDRELILGDTLVIAAISLVSLLIADLLYAVADPRVSFE